MMDQPMMKNPDDDVMIQIPEKLADAYGAIALEKVGDQIVVGIVDPGNHQAIEDILSNLKSEILIKKISAIDFKVLFNKIYNHPPETDIISPRNRLGDILIARGLISQEELERALKLQKTSSDRLGQILVSSGLINRLVLSEALADQFGLKHINLRLEQADPAVVKIMDADTCRKLGCLPVRRVGKILIVAITDPTQMNSIKAEIEKLHSGEIEYRMTSEFDIEWVSRAVFHDSYMRESIWGLFYRNPQESAYQTFTKPQIAFFVLAFSLVVGGLFYRQYQTLLYFNILISFIYLGISIFRFWIAFRGASAPVEAQISQNDLKNLKESDLPVYTILIPVFKEKEVLPSLLQSLENLDYPKSKLDIKLLLEEVDKETRDEAMRIKPPGNIEFITIPDSKPRTKPKACNYGLISARGKYLVIYDAEDKPEPDQLKKVVVAFKQGGDDLVCVQAKLNYYNRNQNMLTRWFTCEYSNWFDMILPGLDRENFPIPLGGTSNHFVTEKLRELGGWDPFNVTEDADLGIRMYKHHYKTVVVDSTTFEEANSQIWNWIRQRTRWIKGYMQTWLVDMRHPFKLLRELGLKGILGFHLTVGGTPFLFIINPIFWVLTTMSFVFRWELLSGIFPPAIFLISSFNLIVGNFVFVYLNVISSFRRGYYELGKYALLSPIYWILMSVASWRALWQLIFKPFVWEKTTHGLYKADQPK
jgi:cellulose synthase/poly-beta-1,6-N-acetylglucosamine synthase-like glycosyltransferase